MSTYEELLEEVAASIAPNEVDREAGWFTVGDIHLLRPHMSMDAVRQALERQVGRGELEKSKALDPQSGHVVNCYKKILSTHDNE